MKKFHRYVYKVEVLSEEELPTDLSLDSINYEITEGHCSGMRLDTEHEEVDGKKMASLLQAQGSDPEFFDLSPEGEDLGDIDE